MNFKKYLNITEKFVTDNSPVILTSVGVVGTIATAVLTARATLEADAILKEERERLNMRDHHRFTKKHLLKLVWTSYIPPFAVGTLTCSSIIFANRVSTRRAAALASAYAVTEQAFSDYKEKVKEHFGEAKEEKVRAEILDDKIKANPPSEVVIIGEGSVLCYETFSARYFMSTMENLKAAQNNINYRIINNNYASLADFYSEIGLKPTAESHEMGWNLDDKLELVFTGTLSEDGRPCIGVEYHTAPIRNYWSFR